MASLINKQMLQELTLEVLTKDMNDSLDIITKEVISKLESQVRANVAARLIGRVNKDYDIQFDRDRIQITIRMETRHV